MEIKKYLKEKQPIVYKTLSNIFLKDKLSHAYIIDGCKGLPIDEIATLFAQSIICQNKDEDGLACEECIDCKKIAKNGYLDFKIFEGKNIKIDDIINLQKDFSTLDVEGRGAQIYIIKNIENVQVLILNKLLKFVEEPDHKIISIFTTNSSNSILPTITSRCQIITLKEFQIEELVAFLKSNDIATDDAYLISKISNSSEKNLEILKSDMYPKVKNELKESLKYLANKDDYFIIKLTVDVVNIFKNNDSYSDLYLDALEVCLLEAVIAKEDNEYHSYFFDEYIQQIAKKYERIDLMIEDITKAKIDLLAYANKNLVFDKLAISILGR